MAPEKPNLLTLVEEAKSLNSDLFSLTRLQLMASLAGLGRDGSSYRELKAALQLSDGALHSNLKVLEGMGYVARSEARIENKDLATIHITDEGQSAWTQVREWILKFMGNLEAGR
ncbi:MAG TPA: transcriptional regulator [Thermoplasmata archaeon]|nr:transcriptional regulator [Thermoplasmata archaeon]